MGGVVLLAGLLFLGFPSVVEGKSPFHTRSGRALEGYDAVSYPHASEGGEGQSFLCGAVGGVLSGCFRARRIEKLFLLILSVMRLSSGDIVLTALRRGIR